MIVMRYGIAVSALLFIVIVQLGSGAGLSVGAQSLPTTKQELESHGIAINPRSLNEALRSGDSEVRALAAEQLADDEMHAAIPSLLDALRREQDPIVRAKVAFFLSKLGDATGRAVLGKMASDDSSNQASRLIAAYGMSLLGDPKGDAQLAVMCASNKLPAALRIKAATYAHALRRSYCDRAVPEIVRTSDDRYAVMQGLNLLPNLVVSSMEDEQDYIALAIMRLDSPDVGVSISAIQALGRLKAVSAIPALQRAASREPRSPVRDTINETVKQLQALSGSAGAR